MNKLSMVLLLLGSTPAFADNDVYTLNPRFSGMDTVEFARVDGARGKTLQGTLVSEVGTQREIPDMCEPEGGNPLLSDAYTLQGKIIYFLFTCAWRVKHLGVNLNGIQYETFVYLDEKAQVVKKSDEFSKLLSGYEGSLEGGARSYAWYIQRKIAIEKILQVEAGVSEDSLSLAHQIVLDRLKNTDYDAVKAYLDENRLNRLFIAYPVGRSTITAYNDLGYALGLAGENDQAYGILARVEQFAPNRVVVKLNIADILWSSDRIRSKVYYKEYIDLMQRSGRGALIPKEALERSLD